MIRFNFRSEKLEAQTLRYIQISLWPGFCYPPIPTYGGIPALMLVAAFGFGADDRQYGYTYPATVRAVQCEQKNGMRMCRYFENRCWWKVGRGRIRDRPAVFFA